MQARRPHASLSSVSPRRGKAVKRTGDNYFTCLRDCLSISTVILTSPTALTQHPPLSTMRLTASTCLATQSGRFESFAALVVLRSIRGIAVLVHSCVVRLPRKRLSAAPQYRAHKIATGGIKTICRIGVNPTLTTGMIGIEP